MGEIHGDVINNYFIIKRYGDVGCFSGEWYETGLNVFVLIDPDNNIMIMYTFSGLNVSEGNKKERKIVNGEIIKFKYPEVVDSYIR